MAVPFDWFVWLWGFWCGCGLYGFADRCGYFNCRWYVCLLPVRLRQILCSSIALVAMPCNTCRCFDMRVFVLLVLMRCLPWGYTSQRYDAADVLHAGVFWRCLLIGLYGCGGSGVAVGCMDSRIDVDISTADGMCASCLCVCVRYCAVVLRWSPCRAIHAGVLICVFLSC